ncbi:MAG: selenide, water dikinase SelD [Candidatus Lokiarchaeota archaeon]|nr:selenide, water dikinase SelD [Candidatus Lokiarchaeota archaeon]
MGSGLDYSAEDCAVKPIGNKILATNVDIFTPIHDDPIVQGEITACNATNDLFAMNVIDIIMYLSFLGVPVDQPEEITQGLIKGQRNFLKQFGADINGGHTIINPWPISGGIVVGIADKKDLIPKQLRTTADTGDLFITKPIGIQAAMAIYRIQKDEDNVLNELFPNVKKVTLDKMVDTAVEVMRKSNHEVAHIIRKYHLRNGIASMTDITGFGLKQHIEEIVQGTQFDISINTLPIIVGTDKISDGLGYDLMGGCAAETAGPMLLCIDPNEIEHDEILRVFHKEKVPIWSIGQYFKGNGKVTISQNPKIIQVEKIN